MNAGNSIETIADLETLIGSYENIRLEFKSSLLFYQKPGADGKSWPDREQYYDKLTREISGFANTEGGQIVIGMRTQITNNQPDRAIGLDDGIPYKDFSPDQIQRAIEARISPQLIGMRFRHIPANKESFYLVITVPKGYTAHQANDKRYYGRSEFESVPLHDNVIRLLMSKGKSPQAVIKVNKFEIKRRGQPSTRHTFVLELNLENNGDINITEFKVLINMAPVFRGHLFNPSEHIKDLFSDGFSLAYRDGHRAPYGSPQIYTVRNQQKDAERPLSVNVYPGEQLLIYKVSLEIILNWDGKTLQEHIKESSQYMRNVLSEAGVDDLQMQSQLETIPETLTEDWQNGLMLYWTLFLPNTQPIAGEVDLRSLVPNYPPGE